MFLIKHINMPLKKDFSGLKAKYGIRRMPDHFLQLIACADELFSGMDIPEDFGLIYLSHFGSASSTANMMYDLLDYPPDQAAPGHFTHSVFNAPVSCLAKVFQSHGPALSLAGFHHGEEAAAITAQTWLQTGFCRDLLLIRTDEHTAVTEAAQIRLYPVSDLYMLSAKGSRELCISELTGALQHE